MPEVHAALVRRESGSARIVLLIRNYVAPVAALFVLLTQTSGIEAGLTWTRVTATVLGFLVILVLINGVNFVVFGKARAGTWRERLPSIFVDVLRFLLIVISVAVLFSVVWGADVGGLFTALGIGSIIIGLALQNAVGSVLSGLLLLFEQPFKIGDWLDAAGVRGRVDVAHHAADETFDAALVLHHQHFERPHVALFNAGHQQGIGVDVRGSHSAAPPDVCAGIRCRGRSGIQRHPQRVFGHAHVAPR